MRRNHLLIIILNVAAGKKRTHTHESHLFGVPLFILGTHFVLKHKNYDMNVCALSAPNMYWLLSRMNI